MIPGCCIMIETKKFPPLPGEADELVNPGMYGKALCQYLERELPQLGIKVPFFCNEDWGWWLEVEQGSFKLGLCIYSIPEGEADPNAYAIMPTTNSERRWSWRRFRMVDISRELVQVVDTLEQLFKRDSEIRSVTRHDDLPI
jgi:hypothetical protein